MQVAEATLPAEQQGEMKSSGQTRIANYLALTQQGELLFVHGLGWHHWDGQRWSLDQTGHARRAVLKVLQQAWNVSLGDPEVAKDVRACMSAGAQAGVLDIASILPQFSASVSEMDADPYKLNVANGTLDLLTGELLPHDPNHRITKVAAAAYDPEADSSEWEAFLARVLPDADVREFLSRFVGLSLLGVVREHILGIATGTGANGKGTFYGAVSHALGDYSHTAESDLFMTVKTNANAASPAVLGLRGTRFVVCSETEEGQSLAAALVKNLTGGDLVTARALHKMPVTFKPSHTALMVTNFLPKAKGNDPALWRRICVIPFDVVIPEAERDPELPELLEKSADAILGWAMRGLRDYFANKLRPPAAVRVATDRYKADSNAVERYLKARVDTSNPDVRELKTKLWNEWKRWATEEGIDHGGQSDFYKELEKRGFSTVTVRGTRMFKGLAILPDSLTDDDEILEVV